MPASFCLRSHGNFVLGSCGCLICGPLIAVRAEVSGKEVVSLLRGRTHRDWKVLSDASRVVNRQAMDTLRLHASQLRAKRIVARRAQHRHGFAKSRKIELTFMEGNEQAEKRVIEIGAASPQGCFARTHGQGNCV